MTIQQFWESLKTIIKNPDWWTAFGTVGAVIISLFYEPIKRIFFRPELKIEFQNREPFLLQRELKRGYGKDKVFFVTLKIINEGKVTARTCEARLESIRYETGEELLKLGPQILHWSNQPRDITRPTDIKPYRSEYVDLLYSYEGISRNEGHFAIVATSPSPAPYNSVSELILGGQIIILEKKGKYNLEISVYAENSETSTLKLQLEWDNIWNNFKLKKL